MPRPGCSRGGQRSAAAGRGIRERNPRFIVSVARGSSDHAASFLKYAIELTAGIPVASVGPSIASIYGAKLRLDGTVCLSISQSGKSPDIVAMAKQAKAGGAMTVALTNTPGFAAGAGIRLSHRHSRRAGTQRRRHQELCELGVAGLALMAHCTEDVELLAALKRLPEQLRAASNATGWSLPRRWRTRRSLFILGRGPSYAIASEAALKFKETCGMHAEAYSAAEVMHGPLALVGPGFRCWRSPRAMPRRPPLPRPPTRWPPRARAVFATSLRTGQARQLPHVATGHPLTDPLPLIVSFYAFVEAFARRLGLNPDEPRNLRKVTETR